MARLNLTLPDSLKNEMQLLSNANPLINWSSIAAKAFRKYIKKHRMRSVWTGTEHDIVPLDSVIPGVFQWGNVNAAESYRKNQSANPLISIQVPN